MTEDRTKEEQVVEIPTKLNPWRECIDGQLRGDLWGYISPGDPRTGAKYTHRECSLSLVKNGVYGGMFVTGCISAAIGYNKLNKKWIEPLNDTIKSAVADFGQGTISDLVERTVKLKEKFSCL